MVTKKDFEAVANIIEDNATEIDGDCLAFSHYIIIPRNTLIMELADYFAEQNPNFNREKFIKACGL